MEESGVSTLAVERTAMTKTDLARIALPLLLLPVLVRTAIAGDSAIVTLNDFPEYVVAGTRLNLTFTIQRQDQTLLSGLRPSIRATTTGGLTAKASAAPRKGRGQYTAALSLPQVGDWTIRIVSGFNDTTLTLPTLKVIAQGSAAPPPFSPATRGVRLFSTKGCVGCHRHVEVNPERATDAKMDLSGKRFPQEYLGKFLADPSIKSTAMPNPELKDDEIAALSAFINKLVLKTVR
jgi:cytochrome c553